VVASTVVVVPNANRDGGGRVLLRDGHGSFVPQMPENAEFNRDGATPEEVAECVRLYLVAIQQGRAT
jgi:hypothetical protein